MTNNNANKIVFGFHESKATPKTAESGEKNRDEKRAPPEGFNDIDGLGQVVSLQGLAFNLGRIDRIGGIAGQQLPAHGLI